MDIKSNLFKEIKNKEAFKRLMINKLVKNIKKNLIFFINHPRLPED